MQYVDLGNGKLRATCNQCGQIFDFHDVYLRRKFDASRCKDCKARKSTKVTRAGDYCTAWSGDFDFDTMTPMYRGRPYKPGFRKCGAADCVRPSHILTVEALERERNDLSYRTGIKLNATEFKKQLKREKSNK